MDTDQKSNIDLKDHDLLIRVDTKVDGLGREISGIRNDLAGRLGKVENNKVDKEDFENFKKTLFLDQQKAEIVAKQAFEEYRKTIDKELTAGASSMKTMSDNIDSLKKFMYLTMGIAIAAQFIIPFIARRFGW